MRRPHREVCSQLGSAIDAYIEKADTSLAKALEAAGFVDCELTTNMLKELETTLTGLLTASDVKLIESMQRFADLRRWWALSLLDSTSLAIRLDDVADVLRNSFEKYMPKFVQSYTAAIDNEIAITGITRRTTDFINGWSKQLSKLMRLGSDERVAKLVQESIANGESIEKLTRKIHDAGIRNYPWQARRVALTETLRAHSYSQLESFRTNPSVKAKRWRHTGAKFSKPRENHVAMNGVTVPVDDPFTLQGADGITYYPQCPRDIGLSAGESINCHCLVQPVVDTEKLGLSADERQTLYEEARKRCDADWEAALERAAKQRSHDWRIAHDTTGNEAIWIAAETGKP